MNDPSGNNAEATDEALAQFFEAAEDESQDPRVEELRRLQEFHRALLELTPKTFVTTTLLGVNVAVFVLMVASGVHFFSPQTLDLIKWGADYGPKTACGEWWRLLTCMFVHIGLIHLALNMYFLWAVGHFVERLLGNTGFLIMYVVSGLAGSLASVYWNPFIVSAGASGALFGVFGALLGFLLLRHDSIPPAALARLRNSALAFLGYNLVFGLAVPGIDLMAHGGGFVGGLVCGLAMSQRLGPNVIAGRRVRNLLVAAGGAGCVVAAVLLMPKDADDFFGELDHFTAAEKQVLETYNSAVRRLENKEITRLELAEIIQRDVLPQWRSGTEPFVNMNHVSQEQAKHVSAVREYVQAQRKSWERLVEKIREDNPEKEVQSKRHAAATERALDKLMR